MFTELQKKLCGLYPNLDFHLVSGKKMTKAKTKDSSFKHFKKAMKDLTSNLGPLLPTTTNLTDIGTPLLTKEKEVDTASWDKSISNAFVEVKLLLPDDV